MEISPHTLFIFCNRLGGGGEVTAGRPSFHCPTKCSPSQGHMCPTQSVRKIYHLLIILEPASVVQWPECLATDPEVPGSIPCAARFSE
jgi:hypothetical protein